VFYEDNGAIVYYVPGTAGWGSTFADIPAVPTTPQAQFSYTTSAGAITITGYTGPGGAIIIPPLINNLPVTSIGSGAFFDCTTLGSVTIPPSVTSIGNLAFYDCASLTSATIGNGVTSIGTYAFEYCSNLTVVTIGAGITNIANYAFSGCSSLTSVYFMGTAPAANSTVFSGDGNATVYYLPGTPGWGSTFANLPAMPATPPSEFSCTTSAGAVTITGYTGSGAVVFIPSTIDNLPVTIIGEYAFWNNEGIASVTIPASVTNIEDYAFFDCTSLTNAAMGDDVISIGDDAFFGCTSLANATMGGDVTSIGDYAFAETSLTNITIPDSVTNIGSDAFWDCASLTSVTIPGSVSSIGYEAFLDCASLTAITVDTNNLYYSSENGVLFNESRTTLIECPGGMGGSYTIPDSVTNIGEYAFVDCASLTSITIPASVTNIGEYAFSGCSGLTSITIPGSVSSIGDYAFEYCTGLTSITLDDGVTSIGDGAFFYCTSLAGITIPAGVTSLGEQVFSYCTNLAGVTIPGSVASIGYEAFYDCAGLASITIPVGVTSLGEWAFLDCASLTSVNFEGNAPTAGPNVFSGDFATVYYLPCTSGWGSLFAGLPAMPWWQVLLSYTTNAGAITITGCSGLCGAAAADLPAFINGLPVTSIGTNAFENFTNLTSVAIPASVTTIGDDAFYGCTNLTIVYFNGNAPIADSAVFANDNNATVYYVSGATGWSSNFAGLPAMPTTPQAQFAYTTNVSGIAITGYTGAGGAVFIPPVINNVPVTSIGNEAFEGFNLTSVTIPASVTSIIGDAFEDCTSLTAITVNAENSFYSSVNGVLFDKSQTTLVECPGGLAGNYTIPDSVTSIGAYAFAYCVGLSNLTIPNSVTSIGNVAFFFCTSLASVTIPGSVSSIGDYAFYGSGVTSVTIGNGVTSIGDYALSYCLSLTSVYFGGNAPTADSTLFSIDNTVTAYYLPGTTGWSDFSDNTGVPVVLWNPLIQAGGANFGVENNQFGFNITGTANIPIVVEACTNLARPVWTALTNVTLTNGLFYFSDPQWTNYPARFYGLGFP
jgi:hypothetical protein